MLFGQAAVEAACMLSEAALLSGHDHNIVGVCLRAARDDMQHWCEKIVLGTVY
jgi:hypothetical protein